MARPDVDLVELRLAREVDPARGHERERALDLGGERLVAAALRRARDELLVPDVHLGEVGEAALRERAQQVQRRRGLVVALRASARDRGRAPRRSARRRGSCGRGTTGISPSADLLGRRRARLRELAGDPTDLHHRQRGAVGQDDGHLQEDLQLLADRDRRELVERLGAVARLEQERAARGDLGRARRAAARASPAKTSGGNAFRRAGPPRARASSGHSGLVRRLERPPGGRGPGAKG